MKLPQLPLFLELHFFRATHLTTQHSSLLFTLLPFPPFPLLTFKKAASHLFLHLSSMDLTVLKMDTDNRSTQTFTRKKSLGLARTHSCDNLVKPLFQSTCTWVHGAGWLTFVFFQVLFEENPASQHVPWPHEDLFPDLASLYHADQENCAEEERETSPTHCVPSLPSPQLATPTKRRLVAQQPQLLQDSPSSSSPSDLARSKRRLFEDAEDTTDPAQRLVYAPRKQKGSSAETARRQKSKQASTRLVAHRSYSEVLVKPVFKIPNPKKAAPRLWRNMVPPTFYLARRDTAMPPSLRPTPASSSSPTGAACLPLSLTLPEHSRTASHDDTQVVPPCLPDRASSSHHLAESLSPHEVPQLPLASFMPPPTPRKKKTWQTARGNTRGEDLSGLEH